LMGRKQTCRAEVTEPHPGRVLVETDLGPSGIVTTFQVDPAPAPGESRVTISTRIAVRSGLAGKVERFLITRLLRPIYERELQNLATFVTSERTGNHSLTRA